MAECPKCKGNGWYPNPRYPNPSSWSWAGEPSFKCSKCKETGYIIGNVKDVLSFLKVLQNELRGEMLIELKQCIDTIEKS
jgi:hypothetical protein